MCIFGVAKRGMILWGIFFTLIGTIILLSNYQVSGFSFELSRDWPIILIAYGLWKIILGINKRRRLFWGIFIALLGIIILLSNYQVPWFSFKISRDWPIILISWGVLKIIDAMSGRVWCKSGDTVCHKSEVNSKKNYRKIIEDLNDGTITVEEAIEKMKEN